MTQAQNQPGNPLRDLPLVPFEFETVTVDRQGQVIERRAGRAQQFVEQLGQGILLEMVFIPGGAFWMGSRPRQGYEDETPRHYVRLEPFLLGKYPLTQQQWAAVMPWIPPYRGPGLRQPVDRVSWEDAQEFYRQLEKRTHRAYRLPSEAQWEYACRADTSTPFAFGETITTDLANYVGEHTYLEEPKGIYRHGSTEVGSFPPNAFGLYDLHGNLWEWCADAWHDDYQGAPLDGSPWQGSPGALRVVRGGSWHDPPHLCRSACRMKFDPREREDFVGFRLAMGLAACYPERTTAC